VIALLDNGQDLETCAGEIGTEVGQLLTPLTRYRLRDPEKPWAIDNGAFSKFDRNAFLALLKRESKDKRNCKFVCAPDVVASAARTLEVYELWKFALQGWPVAFVVQDGQENLPIPWKTIEAIFVGGTTSWKESAHVERIIRTAKDHFGKWVHVGRVNTPDRYEHFERLGADSCDGSGLARYTHMRQAIANRNAQEKLFAEHV